MYSKVWRNYDPRASGDRYIPGHHRLAEMVLFGFCERPYLKNKMGSKRRRYSKLMPNLYSHTHIDTHTDTHIHRHTHTHTEGERQTQTHREMTHIRHIHR